MLLDDMVLLVQVSLDFRAPCWMEKSGPVLRLVCVRNLLGWHFGWVLQGAVIENKSSGEEMTLNVMSRSSLQTRIRVDTSLILDVGR